MEKNYFVVRRMDISDKTCHRLFFECIEENSNGDLTMSKPEAEKLLKSKLETSINKLDYDEYVIYDIRFNKEIYYRLLKAKLKYDCMSEIRH
jgi:hypothetical protein